MRKCSRLPSGWPLANARVRGRPGAARAGVRRACRVTRPTRKHPHGGLIGRGADARGRRAMHMMARRRSKGPSHSFRAAMKVTTTLLKTPNETEKDQQLHPHGGLIRRGADARGRRAMRMMSRRRSKGPCHSFREAMKVTSARATRVSSSARRLGRGWMLRKISLAS